MGNPITEEFLTPYASRLSPTGVIGSKFHRTSAPYHRFLEI